jgi:hypothetical protein
MQMQQRAVVVQRPCVGEKVTIDLDWVGCAAMVIFFSHIYAPFISPVGM